MFTITARTARSEIRTQEEMDIILTALRDKGYDPLLRNLNDSAKHTAGLKKETITLAEFLIEDRAYRRHGIESRSPIGDIMFKDERAFLINPIRKKLSLWEIRHIRQESVMDTSCQHVEDAIRSSLDGRRVRGMDFTWEEHTAEGYRRLARRRAARDTTLESKAPDMSPNVISQAQTLVDGARRSALRKLAQVGKVRTVDSSLKEDDNIAGPLLEQGMVAEEYLLTCRQDSHTICTVGSEERLAANADLKCSICGRSFKDEKVHEILALTEQGRSLLSASHWMTIWVTQMLVDAGVPIESISWNAEAGEDEMDIIVQIMDLKVFFELKDRDFGLGDAYPFSARVSRYGGDFGVVITTDGVAEEAKSFLNERQPGVGRIPFFLIEGVEEAKIRIPELVTNLSFSAIQRALFSLEIPLVSVASPVLEAWLRDRCT